MVGTEMGIKESKKGKKGKDSEEEQKKEGADARRDVETKTDMEVEDSGGAACSNGRDYKAQAPESKRNGGEAEQEETKRRKIGEEKQDNMKRTYVSYTHMTLPMKRREY